MVVLWMGALLLVLGRHILVLSGYPFTLKSNQFQMSLAASPDLLHHTVWRTWLHSVLRWKMIILPILPTSLIHILSNRLGECNFDLRTERVNTFIVVFHGVDSHGQNFVAESLSYNVLTMCLALQECLQVRVDTWMISGILQKNEEWYQVFCRLASHTYFVSWR